MPDRFAFPGANPNPGGGQTTISYEVPQPGARVTVAIYDVRGRLTRTVVERFESAGHYSETWDLRNDAGQRVAPGIYFCHMEAGDFRDTKKIVLLE